MADVRRAARRDLLRHPELDETGDPELANSPFRAARCPGWRNGRRSIAKMGIVERISKGKPPTAWCMARLDRLWRARLVCPVVPDLSRRTSLDRPAVAKWFAQTADRTPGHRGGI